MGRKQEVSDQEILESIKLVRGPATAGEIADMVSISANGVNTRLDDLVERDPPLVHEKQVGARAKVYWLTDAGETYIHEPSEP